MSDESEGKQYSDVDISDLPTNSNLADQIAGESEDLERIKRVGEERAESLRDAGFKTIADVRNADVEDIFVVENIGESTAEKIIVGDISELTGVGQRRAEKLRKAGFQTAKDISEADPDELRNVRGVGDTLITHFKIEAEGYEVGNKPQDTEEQVDDKKNDLDSKSQDTEKQSNNKENELNESTEDSQYVILNKTEIYAVWTALFLFIAPISILVFMFVPVESLATDPYTIPDKLSYLMLGVLILACSISAAISTTYWYIIAKQYRPSTISSTLIYFLKLFVVNSLLLILMMSAPANFGAILALITSIPFFCILFHYPSRIYSFY